MTKVGACAWCQPFTFLSVRALYFMKVFVYSKKTSKKIAEIKQVGNVMECEVAAQILITTYGGERYGVYQDSKVGLAFVDSKVDPTCRLVYALTVGDHNENTLLTRNRNNNLLNVF